MKIASFSSVTLFDLDRYPIHRRGSTDYNDVVAMAKAGLSETNCAQLPNFLRMEALGLIQQETAALATNAVFRDTYLNPYFLPVPEDASDDHVLRRLAHRRHGMIRADQFDRSGAIITAFHSTELCNFVADCLGYDELYPFCDPFGSVNVNVQPAGCEFPWHFDTNDFTISFGLKQSVEGGVFEYVPDLRTQTDQNFEGVRKVLDGDQKDISTLVLRPGDLQLFKGGYTLHRVTAPVNEVRYSLLFSYSVKPDHVTTAEQAIGFWGEAHPLHLR